MTEIPTSDILWDGPVGLALEDLRPYAVVRGILPDRLVTVLSVQWLLTLDLLKVVYRTPEGEVGDRLLERQDERRIEFVEQSRPGIPWDGEPIERLLTATGKTHVPNDLDKEKLADGLEACLATYLAVRERASDRPKMDRLRRLGSISKAAKRLKKQLEPDDVWDWSQDQESRYLHSDIGYLIKRIEGKISDLNHELEWGPDSDQAIRLGVDPRALADRWKAYSPFEWTAGHYLPELFAKHFGVAATFHRRNADVVPESPTIRFVEQALVELGILNDGKPYSRGSIAKALSDLRTGRRRKKPR
jgi:hypothetical protein